MNQHLLPVPGGDLLVVLSPIALTILRLLDGHNGRLLSVTLDGRTLQDWTLDRLAASVGALRPDRLLFAERDHPTPKLLAPLRDALHRAGLQAGIEVVEIPDPTTVAGYLAANPPREAKIRGRPSTLSLRLRGFLRRFNARV